MGIGLVTGAAALVAIVVLLLFYRRQTFSYLTHLKGGPSETWAWEDHRPEPDQRIAVVGDSGEAGEPLASVVTAMERTAGSDPYDVLLLLGDLVYPDGEVDRVQDRVFAPFASILDRGADLRAILGNHDVMRGTGDEMMEALGQDGRRWSTESGDLLLVGLDSTDLDRAQLDWLDRTLAASDATWRVVAVHHPPYSAGYQGSATDVRRALAPILRRHGVQLVLSGHEHDYQRSKVMDGVTYVVTGGGSLTRRTGDDEFTAISWSWHHFVDLAVYEDRLVLRAVGGNGRVADEVVLQP